jgi:hypothetical protein
VTLGLIALVASVALNVFLLTTRATRESDHPSARASDTPRAVPAEPSNTTATDAGARPEVVTSRYRDLDRATLERQLAEAEKRIHDLLPMEERFKVDEPSPESEARLRPHLERIYNVKPGDEPPYELECRGDVCRLTKIDSMAWQDQVHEDEGVSGMFASMSFVGDEVYLQLNEPGKGAGFRLVGRVLRNLYEGEGSKLIGDCKRNNPTPTGALRVTVSLDLKARKFLVSVDGDLAKQAVGVCIRRAVEDAVTRIEIAPDVTMMEEAPLSITVP